MSIKQLAANSEFSSARRHSVTRSASDRGGADGIPGEALDRAALSAGGCRTC
jgi:hypothetical protein